MLKEDRESKRRLASRLKNVQLFAGLEDKNLETIAESGREVFFETATKILRQGDLGLAFLLILDGGVEVNRDGKRLASLGRGQFFGEMTAVDDQPRSADVVVRSRLCASGCLLGRSTPCSQAIRQWQADDKRAGQATQTSRELFVTGLLSLFTGQK